MKGSVFLLPGLASANVAINFKRLQWTPKSWNTDVGPFLAGTPCFFALALEDGHVSSFGLLPVETASAVDLQSWLPWARK